MIWFFLEGEILKSLLPKIKEKQFLSWKSDSGVETCISAILPEILLEPKKLIQILR